MQQITLRIPEDTLESIDSEADEHGKSRSEHIRDILESRSEHAEADKLRDEIGDLEQQLDEAEAERDRLAATVEDLNAEIDELQSEVDSLEARNTDLTNQLAEANTRIDTANEVVEYVETERTAQERWREAGILGKAKYTVFGMPTDEADDTDE
jgi:chromosome segregation ATPase